MAGYTRQDTANNIANGNVIDADDFDAEYNQLESAFNASSGHSHDGTAGEGAPITKVGPSQDLVVSATQVLPKTTNTLDLGSASVQFKDAHFDGTVDADAFTGPLAGDVTGNLTGNVTGTVSSISNHTTDDLSEGATNQYYTDARSRAAISATGSLSYNSSTGVMSFTQGDTDTVTEGLTNLYYTDARSRSAVSVTDSGGDGSLAYNSGTGVITYTGPSATETRAHFSAGTGVTLTSGEIAIGQAVGTTSDVTFNSVTSNLTGDVTGNADTATTLATARTIAGQSFDGSANITIAPTDLTGVTSTASELNILDGVTATTAEINKLDGVTATTAEINKLDGVTATTTELNYVDGVTSAIQTQLDRRLELISETVLSSNASDVTFTLPTGYRNFQLVFNYVKPTTGTTTLWLEFSTNSGTSWITSGYQSISNRTLSTTETYGSGSTGIIVATNNEADDEYIDSTGCCGVIDIFDPLNANTRTSALVRAVTTNYSTIHAPATFVNSGVYLTEGTVNAINLSHKTGASVASGAVVALYGMKDY